MLIKVIKVLVHQNISKCWVIYNIIPAQECISTGTKCFTCFTITTPVYTKTNPRVTGQTIILIVRNQTKSGTQRKIWRVDEIYVEALIVAVGL